MWNNIKSYFVGTGRYVFIGTWFEFIIPKHIVEQYKWRFKRADKRCHKAGHCIACGCSMPEVLLADKACRVNCYPKMMDRKTWKDYKLKNNIKWLQ